MENIVQGNVHSVVRAHVVKIYGETKQWLQSFLIHALDGMNFPLKGIRSNTCQEKSKYPLIRMLVEPQYFG